MVVVAGVDFTACIVSTAAAVIPHPAGEIFARVLTIAAIPAGADFLTSAGARAGATARLSARTGGGVTIGIHL